MANVDINCVNFNSTSKCTAIGTVNGFHVFSCSPFLQLYSSHKENYRIVELLESSSLIALVKNGGGGNITSSARILTILNLVDSRIICELSYDTSIISVKMNRERFIVVLRDKIYIYDLKSMKLLHIIENLMNRKGVVSISNSSFNNILVYPICRDKPDGSTSSHPNYKIDLKQKERLDNTDNYNNNFGRENIKSDNNSILSEDVCQNLMDQNDDKSSTAARITNAETSVDMESKHETETSGDLIVYNLNELKPSLVIEAHNSELRVVTVSQDGLLLATASRIGTIIRLFRVSDGKKIMQFRRGTYPVRILSMSFSEDCKYLIVTSSTKTVHVFLLEKGCQNSKSNTMKRSDIVLQQQQQQEHQQNFGSNMSHRINNDYVNMESINNNNNNAENISVRNDSETVEDFVYLEESIIPYPSTQFPRTMKDFFKTSTKTISKETTKRLNKYLAGNNNKSNLSLKPRRHYSYCKLPPNAPTNKTIACMGELETVSLTDHPKLRKILCIDDDKLTSIALRYVRVITSDGCLYNFIFNPNKSGECFLSSQYSLQAAYT